jgi:hypothetical protein
MPTHFKARFMAGNLLSDVRSDGCSPYKVA